MNSDGSLDGSFNSQVGTDERVLSVIQSNGSVIIGGYFNYYDNVAKGRLARLNADASLNSSLGYTGITYLGTFVKSVVAQLDNKLIIGGNFQIPNAGGIRNHLARLNYDGTVDPTFNPGTGPGSGSVNQIFAMEFQSTGKLIIVGNFTSYNGTPRKPIARINSDGTLDTDFNPGTGPDNQITSMAIQDDGKIIIGGWFNSYNGTSAKRIARLNVDGSIDLSFNTGAGASSRVASIAIGNDGKILIGGDFTSYDGTPRKRFARLNLNGTLDTSFDPGDGPSGTVETINIQPNGRIIIGGIFTSYNGVSRNGIARVLAEGVVGTNEAVSFAKTVSAYPNPLQDILTIESADVAANTGFILYNLLGQQVVAGSLTGETTRISIGHLPSGTYLLQAGEARNGMVKLIRN